MLAPCIERRREYGPRSPLEGDLFLLVIPDGGGAIALDDEDGFFVHHPSRPKISARRNLRKIGFVDVAGTDQIDARALAAAPFPRFKRDGPQIFDVKVADDRNA